MPATHRSLLLLVLLGLGCQPKGSGSGGTSSADATLVINEAFVDPVGADADGEEWIEIYNAGDSDVDLGGWSVLVFKSNPEEDSGSVTFENGTTIASGGYVMVSTDADNPDAVAYSTSLSPGQGTAGDAIHLVDPDEVIEDALVYGSSNDDGMFDESGSVAVSFAEAPGEGEALARCPDGTDSDDNSVDFQAITAGTETPNAANTCGGSDTGDTGGGSDPADVTLVINEFVANPAGADGSGEEWIEIHNAGAAAADLSGWELLIFKSNPAEASEDFTFDSGVSIPAGGYLLISSDESNPAADVIISAEAIGNGSNGDAIQLVGGNGAIEDIVIFGEDNDDGMLDESGVATKSIAGKPGDDEVIARCPDGTDSDDSGVDFALLDGVEATPGAANDCEGDTGGDDGSLSSDVDLVINEFVANPAGSDSDGEEWVEIYNAGSTEANLSGWSLLSFKSSPTSASEDLIFSGLVVAAGDYVLISTDTKNADADAYIGASALGNGSSGDALHLLDVDGVVEDAVIFGSNNNDKMLDESGSVAISVAPSPGDDEPLARCPNGADSDASGTDFTLLKAGAGTPGSANSCP